MKFARWTFGGAGVYGLLAILPLYFLEDRIAQDTPPAVTHPEFYYGFVGLGLAWQMAFLGIASDPARYRLMMLRRGGEILVCDRRGRLVLQRSTGGDDARFQRSRCPVGRAVPCRLRQNGQFLHHTGKGE